MSATPQIILDAIARRKSAGLELVFRIPADSIGPERLWPCYPHDEATRQRWIDSKAALGWTVVSVAS